GETYLHRGELKAGDRMGSMMAPSIALDGDGFVLGIGSGRARRLRTPIVGVTAAGLDAGLQPQAACQPPRVQPRRGRARVEPGVEGEAVAVVEARGLEVRRWPDRTYSFGGVSLVSRFGAASDPRRDGAVAYVH